MRSGSESNDDAALAAAVAAGDREAFEQAHARFAGAVRSWLSRRCAGRNDVVEELAQQTWTQVWGAISRGRYDPSKSAVSTFVFAVLNHVWLQHCRDAGRTFAKGVETVAAATLDQTLQHAELLEALRECLRDADVLTPDDRDLVSRISQGATERDIAGELGVAPSTLHARKDAAYAKIRRCLALKGFSKDLIEQLQLSLE